MGYLACIVRWCDCDERCMGLRVHGIICGFWFGIWASRTLKLIVLTSTPEESGGLMSLLIPVICHSRKASHR